MNKSKPNKRTTNSSTSFLGFTHCPQEEPPTQNEPRFEYRIEEAESTALDSVFDTLFELLTKEQNQ